MESSNNNNDNYEEEQQQLRKRDFIELDNDVQGQAAAEGEEQKQRPPENLSKKKCEQLENDALENLHLESLTREDLIHLVQKKVDNQNETYKQLEAVRKEAEEEGVNAKEQAKEMTTKMEVLNNAYLASQQKVEELTAEMANQLDVEHQKHLDSAKQAEEFTQRNIQLEQEKEEIQEDLGKKLAEIEEMHKEIVDSMHKKMEEKSEQVAEKAKQIDALLILMQLNESTRQQHQIGLSMPTNQQMKIQLSLETWFDWLAFVPRRRLGKIVPKIGDRKFGSIIQKFLHEYGEITIHCIRIVAPYEEDPSGPYPRVRVWQYNRFLRVRMAETQMPTNIKNIKYFILSYFDQSVLTFMQKFQQNRLLDNVNLAFDKLPSKNILPTALFHILPLINDIDSIEVRDSAQLVDFYDAGNSKEVYELNMKIMEETRFLGTGYVPQNLHPNKIDLYCRWLYQTVRADGKPRVLLFRIFHKDSARISLFIDRIKKDFLIATHPATFFIRIILPKAFQPREGICLDNGKTKERLLAKMEEAECLEDRKEVYLLISRYPLASGKKWIVENENEVLNWDFSADHRRTIFLSKELKVVAI